MGFQVDYFQVGDGESSGDAICLRYGNLYGPRSEQTVIVIDGGTLESGEQLVQHILTHYQTNKVDFVVSTHQDSDHIFGLKVVLDKLEVTTLLMHIPWEHEAEINSLFEKDFTDSEAGKELQKSLDNIRDLEELALEKEVAVVEPFTGMATADGSIHILGPSREFYESLVPNFRQTPDASDPVRLALQFARASVDETASSIIESLDLSTETLDDNGRFTPENESSVILLLTVGEKKILFTGDAGITALTQAADYADAVGIQLSNIHLLHVPHHGSKQNVGPTILNRIQAVVAQISASKQGAPKHPSKKVINALIRRGSTVYLTKSGVICHSDNAPQREGWSSVDPEEFSQHVDN